MRIIIIGAGAAGHQLARRMCADRHDVIMVDINAAALQEIEAQLDVMTVVGPGSSPATLAEAEIAKADLVVAVTVRDEVNILACLLAHAAGVRHTVARIANTDYITEKGPFDLRAMGIDLVVSQKEECAHDLFNVLRLPGTIEVVDILDLKGVAAGIKVDMDSPLAMASLSAFPEPDLINKIRFVALQRDRKLLIPRGDTQFLIGDDVYLIGESHATAEFLKWAFPDRPQFQKIVIAGGGDLGVHLARLLETIPPKSVLLEPDPQRAEYCADRLGDTLVLRIDPLDPEAFDDIGITSTTAFVAATDDDENNIISCLMAEKRGACFTAAQVTKTGYAPIINSLSLLDRAVNPYTSMINAISRFIRGAHIESASSLYSLPGEIIEAHIPASSPWADQTIFDIGNLKGGIIAAILRDHQVIPATGDLRLAAHDRVAMYVLPKAAPKILSAMRGK